MYYVYIIKNVNGVIYKGYTTDLKRRIQEHNNGSTRTTRGQGNHELIWYCAFPTKTQALQFENYLKSGSGIAFMKKHLV